MSKLTERANYLKGLAAGMKLNADKDTHKLLLEILPLLTDMAEQIEALAGSMQELDDYVETIDDDLASLEDAIFEDDEDEDDEDDFHEDEIITYACPHCGYEIEFNADDVDFDENYVCPACDKPVFPDLEDDDEADEADAADEAEEADDQIEDPDQE